MRSNVTAGYGRFVCSYVRPEWTDPVFRDPAGNVIVYGSRWGMGGPPEDTYSVTSHLDRFAPLHTVADALIDYLAATYDCRITGDPGGATVFGRQQDIQQVRRVTPTSESAAALTFAYTAFPGLIVHAGLLHDFALPPCGCDACDESAEGLVDELEQLVTAVTAGRYREMYIPTADLPVGFDIVDGDGSTRGGRGSTDGYPADLLAMAEIRLRALPDGWQPWPALARQ